MNTSFHLPLAVVMALSAWSCVQTVHFPPDLWQDDRWDSANRDSGLEDSATPDAGGTGLDASTLIGGCPPSLGTWQWSLQTEGWSGDATLHGFGPDAHTEQHPLVLIDADPSGTWNALQAGPLNITTDGTWAAGSSTTFACDESTVSWAIVLHDRVGRPIDCIAWGADATWAQPINSQISEIESCQWLPDM
jgi:hypothetical protein